MTSDFPNLLHLSLKGCPKLKGTLPINQTSSTFELSGCPLLFPNPMLNFTENLPTNLHSSLVLNCTNFIMDLTLSRIPSSASFPRVETVYLQLCGHSLYVIVRI